MAETDEERQIENRQKELNRRVLEVKVPLKISILWIVSLATMSFKTPTKSSGIVE